MRCRPPILRSLKYLLTENVQLDAGVNIGLTEATDAVQPFLGLSVRF